MIRTMNPIRVVRNILHTVAPVVPPHATDSNAKCALPGSTMRPRTKIDRRRALKASTIPREFSDIKSLNIVGNVDILYLKCMKT